MNKQKLQFWTRREALGLMTGVAGSIALHSCTQPPSKSSEQATDKPATAKTGSTTWIGYVPLYIAQEKGFFEQAGLKMDYSDFSSGSDAISAFSAGRIDGGANVTSEAVSMAARSVDYKIIMAADNSNGGDGILARNSIPDLKAFKGKQIAVEEGGVSHFFLLQVLKEASLSGKDVTIVNVTPDAAAAAYQAGRVDIAVTYSPFLQKANQAQKEGRIIFDSSKLPTAIVDVYLFRTQYVEQNPKGAKAFIQGIIKGREFIQSNKDEAYAIAAKRLQVKPEDVEEQLKGVKLIDLKTNLEMLGNPDSDVYLLKHMNNLAQFLIEQKQIPKPPDLSKILEPKFLKEVQA